MERGVGRWHDNRALELLQQAVDTNSGLIDAWINLALLKHKIGTIKNDPGLITEARKIVDEKVEQLEDKKTISEVRSIVKSRQYQRDIIPIHVSGRCTNFFYRLANIRKFLRIKWNLEMFLLSDESYRHRNKHFIFTIGKPIPFSSFDRSCRPMEWAARVRDLVYRLPTEKDPALRALE